MRLPRTLHPGAWWLWALGLATAASRTSQILLLLLVIAVTAYVVAARRTDAPWARTYRASLMLGGVVPRWYAWRSRSCSAPTPARRSSSPCPRSRCRAGWPASRSAARSRPRA